jgi:hypothetical protein
MIIPPAIKSLRDEYEHLCALNGVAPSKHTETDVAFEALERASGDSSNPQLAVYARQALRAMALFQPSNKPRQTISIHPSQMVGYGAKVAGYMEAVLLQYDFEGIHVLRPVYVDELPIRSFNGRAFNAKNSSGVFCMLDYGLFRLLHHVCTTAYLLTNQIDSGMDFAAASTSNLRVQVVQAVRVLFESYLQNEAHPLIMPDGPWLDEYGFTGACELSYAIKLFVIAHELAHVRLGHLDNPADKPDNERKWQMEFEADRMAQQTLCSIEIAGKIPFSVAGGGLGFLLIDLMRHEVFKALYSVRPEVQSKSGGHPPPLQRIKRLDEHLRGFFNERSREGLAPLNLLQWIASDLALPQERG